MAHMTKKADFQELASKMKAPKVLSMRGSVYLRDGDSKEGEVEVYRACTMEESGLISAMNQTSKYRRWL